MTPYRFTKRCLLCVCVLFQNPSVSVGPLQAVLGSLAETISLKKTGGLDDTYWAVMKHFGVM